MKLPPTFTENGFDPANLPMRTHEEWVRDARHITLTRDHVYVRRFGINHLSILHPLESISLPRSFPVDSLHAFFEGINTHMFDHFCGRFLFNETTLSSHINRSNTLPLHHVPQDQQSDHVDSAGGADTESVIYIRWPAITSSPPLGNLSDDSHDHAPQSKRHHLRRRTPGKSPTTHAKGKAPNRHEPPKSQKTRKPPSKTAKFISALEDEYNITPENWIDIGKVMLQSASAFPAAFSNGLRDIYEHSEEFKAAEWKTWTTMLSPIYLKRFLPPNLYEGYIVMDYDVFVPIPIFLPLHLSLLHRRSLKRQNSIFPLAYSPSRR